MASNKNIQLLKETKEKLEKSQAVFFVDYQRLTHKQLEEARKIFKDKDSELSIIKNNLVRIAFKDDEKVNLEEKLEGPMALLFSYKDPVATAKALYEFYKKNNLPEIKFGFFEKNVIGPDIIERLATIPSREVLLSKMLGTLKGPMNGFVYALNYNISKFVFVLKAIEDKKQKTS